MAVVAVVETADTIPTIATQLQQLQPPVLTGGHGIADGGGHGIGG
ncbi:MAG: hypothetical protein ACLPUO_11200 [Streptosporangiaceae bacterium]